MVSNSEKWGIYVVIDSLSQAGEILHGCLPVLHQDLRGQFAPQRVQGIPVCRWDLETDNMIHLLNWWHSPTCKTSVFPHYLTDQILIKVVLIQAGRPSGNICIHTQQARACHHLLGFSSSVVWYSNFSHLYPSNQLNYVMAGEWNLTDKRNELWKTLIEPHSKHFWVNCHIKDIFEECVTEISWTVLQNYSIWLESSFDWVMPIRSSGLKTLQQDETLFKIRIVFIARGYFWLVCYQN